MAGTSRGRKALSIRVEGSREAAKSLRQAAGNLADLKDVNDEVARIIYAPALAHAPVGRSTRRSRKQGPPGRLKASGRASGTKGSAEILFGNRIKYARPIHWGWRARNIPENRFLWDAQIDTRPRWTRVYLDGIQKVLDKIKGA